jgi:excisionase family DNA binding protein
MPINVEEPKELLTVKECAEIIGVGKRRVLQYIHEDRLKANKMGGMWFISRDDLDEFMEVPRKPGNLTGKPRKPVE